MVASARAVGVGILRIDALFDEVARGRSVLGDIARGRDVIGRDRVPEEGEDPSAPGMSVTGAGVLVMFSKRGGLRT